MFNAIDFCQTYGVPYTTSGKHSRQGWAQVACPFCTGNPGWHGGFNVSDTRFKGDYRCWRCGWHWGPKVIASLLGISIDDAKQIHRRYRGKENNTQISGDKMAEKCILPPGYTSLLPSHREYLVGRGFDPNVLAREWGIVSAPYHGPYSHRIIAPVKLNGRLVSYQCRDTTGMSDLPYKACQLEDEVVHHKNTLYGIDKAKSYGNTCVVVEGIFDVWMLGAGAVGTFGIEYTPAQARMIRKNFVKAFVLYDPEDQAQQKALELYQDLSGFIATEILNLKKYGDPAEIPHKEAREIMADLLGY